MFERFRTTLLSDCSIRIAKLLVSLGARTYIEDHHGLSPLDVAIDSGAKDVELYLKEASVIFGSLTCRPLTDLQTRTSKDNLDSQRNDSPLHKEKARLEINTSQEGFSATPETSPMADRALALSPGSYQFGVAFDPTLPLPISKNSSLRSSSDMLGSSGLQGLQMQGVLFERVQGDPTSWDEIFMALRSCMPKSLFANQLKCSLSPFVSAPGQCRCHSRWRAN